MKLFHTTEITIACLLTLCACATIQELSTPGSGRTTVLKPPESKVHFSSVEFSEGNSTVNLPEDAKRVFCEKLNEFLYEKGGFQKGSDGKIQYRFIQYSPVDLWGEERTLTLDVTYLDTTGQEVARIRTEGKIKGGIANYKGPLLRCAKEIAEYARQNFK